MDTTSTRAPRRPRQALKPLPDHRPPDPGRPTPAIPPGPGRVGRAASRCAGFAARRPWFVIGAWLLIVGFLIAGGSVTGTQELSGAAAGVGQSRDADQRVVAAGLTAPATESVLLTSATAAQTATAAGELERRLAAVPSVASVRGGTTAPDLRTAGGRSLLVQVTLRGSPGSDDAYLPVAAAVAAVTSQHPGVRLVEAGDSSGDAAVTAVLDQDLRRSELVSLPITLVVLLLAFGALVAACVPLVLGLTVVAGALGALGLVSHLVPASGSASTLVVLIGLAVGVDYSLFFIRRERAERRSGRTRDAALAAAVASTGRAVIVAGATVMVAMAGLLLTGMAVFASMAIATVLVVALAVLGSVTVLPAVLAVLGDRIDAGRPGRLLARLFWLGGSRGRSSRRGPARRGVWARIAAPVSRRPAAALVVSVAVLAALAAPALGLRTAGETNAGDLPPDLPIVAAANAIQRAFPGAPSDAVLVVSGPDLRTPAARAGLTRLGEQAAAVTGGSGPIGIRVAGDGHTATVSVPMPELSQQRVGAVVAELRSGPAAGTASLIPGATTLITGEAAGGHDFTTRLDRTTPIVVGFVLAVAFVLLLVTFGSPLLALATIGLDLLSVGVAYGVLAAVFQRTWAQGWLDFTSSGTIIDWVPLFAFVILFGLSMDYTVIVLERIREARRDGLSPADAAAAGVAATGGTVTSAAAVMIAVFSIFAGLHLVEFKQLGVALATAVAVDATLVRGVALPAVVSLIGRRWHVSPRSATTVGA